MRYRLPMFIMDKNYRDLCLIYYTYVANAVTKPRKLSLGGCHNTVGDDFARRVLYVDGAVRREVFW